MSRELKFRFYDEVIKKFVYSDEYDWSSNHAKLRCFFSAAERYAKEGSEQQFTGLLDSKGKDIYEGDIVEYQQPYRASKLTHPAVTDSYREIVAVVSYSEKDFMFKIGTYGLGSSMIKTRKDIKIIGNIFEHPHLLTK